MAPLQAIQKPNPVNTPAAEPAESLSERALQAIGFELRRIADVLERTPAEAVEDESLEPADEGLFQALRKWRADESRKLGMPPYIVATDRVLRAVAQARPLDLEQLRAIPGFGPTKTEKYGQAIVAVVAAA